jgi:hypothetical protein
MIRSGRRNMLVEFKVVKHSLRSTEIIEVWYDGKLRATITPGDENTAVMRVISRHVANVEREFGAVLEVIQVTFFKD